MIALKHSSEGTADIGYKPARQMNLRGGLCLWMQRVSKTPAPKLSVNSVLSVVKNITVSICVNQCLNTICENLWLKTKPYLKKQTQFFPISSPKTTIPPNPKPIQSQLKPIQTQFLPLKIIRVNSWNSLLKTIPFYAKRTQTSPFSAQKPRLCQKTNPKQTQTKPNKAKSKNSQNEPIPCIDKAL